MSSYIFSFHLLSCLAVPHVCRGTPGLFIIALPADFNASMFRCVNYYSVIDTLNETALNGAWTALQQQRSSEQWSETMPCTALLTLSHPRACLTLLGYGWKGACTHNAHFRGDVKRQRRDEGWFKSLIMLICTFTVLRKKEKTWALTILKSSCKWSTLNNTEQQILTFFCFRNKKWWRVFAAEFKSDFSFFLARTVFEKCGNYFFYS